MPSAIKNSRTKTEGSNKCNRQLKQRLAVNVNDGANTEVSDKKSWHSTDGGKNHIGHGTSLCRSDSQMQLGIIP